MAIDTYDNIIKKIGYSQTKYRTLKTLEISYFQENFIDD